MTENFKELAAEIKRQDTKRVADKYFSTARKVGYICECGNGTGENGTGAEIYFNIHHNRHELKCFKCGKNFNNLEIIAYGEKLNLGDKKDFDAAVKIGCEIYGLNFGTKYINAPKNPSENLPTNDNNAELKLIHTDIQAAQSNLETFLETQGGSFRDLNLNTLNHFGCGYLPEWISPKTRREVERGKRDKLPPTSRRFIIPTANHYNAVLLPADRTDKNKDYWKMHAGTKEIFGADFLPLNPAEILVVEGEVDAMSIWQATQGKYIAIATGGAADKRVVNFLQDKFATHKPNILILFDSDDAGRLNAPKLREQLLKIGFCAVCKFLSADVSKIDANQILQEQGDEKLAEIISSIVEDAQADFAAIKENFETSRTDGRASDKIFSADAHSLQDKLQEVNKKLADFEQEKSAAIEKLKSAVSFDKDFVFSDDILNAAAFAKLFDGNTYTSFRIAIQNQNKKEKFIREWQGEVRDRMTDIKDRQADLLAQKKSINAQIVSANFFSAHDELKNFIRPEGYEISNTGIEKIVGDKSLTVSRVPAVIKSKSKSVEDKTFKLILAYLSENGAWQSISAKGEEIIFNARKLIDLRAYGLPVTSTNANLFVDYLDAFKAANEKILPMSLTVSRCGWHNFYGQDYFVEPRRKNFISDDTHHDRNIEVVVDDSSTFAKSLKSVGSLSEWRKAYDIAKKSPIARLIIAASVAAPLLKIFDGERNFVLYIYGTTRGGKSTCLLCGASAVGNTDMVISFDGTNNGLLGRAAETTDYAFFVDEKQSADARLKDQFQRFVYSVANGKERQRANKDGSFKSVREWQNITICNGETELLDDNATEGAFTRLLQIHAPKTILAADDCKEIRRIIRHNHGHALPLVIDKIFEYGFDQLRKNFNDACEGFAENFPKLLDDYRRYVAIMTLADAVLNMCLGVDEDAAFADAVDNAKIIFEFVPTIADISDFEREKDFLLGFIAAKSTQFEGTPDFLKGGGREILGKFDDDFVYITARALKQACDESHFDYKKVVADSVENKFFIADEKVRQGRKTPFQFVQKKINGINTNCYRIPKEKISDTW